MSDDLVSDLETATIEDVREQPTAYRLLMKKAAGEITRLCAELATARRDALAEIKQDTDELIEQGRQDGMEQAAGLCDNLPDSMARICAIAIRAAATEVKP